MPSVEIEATVISLSLDAENNGSGALGPRDKGLIRISRVLNVDNPYSADLGALAEGKDVTVEFLYSARPAKISVIAASAGGETQDSTTSVSSSLREVTQEDGYVVYRFRSTSIATNTEKVLLGVSAGVKFHSLVSYYSPDRITVGEYDVIMN